MSNNKRGSFGAAASKDHSPLEKAVNKLETVVYYINAFFHDISKVLLLFMMLLIAGDVTGRYFFNTSIAGAHETAGLALAVIVFFSLGSTQIAGDHISIDFLVKRFPRKLQETIHLVFNMVIIALLLFTSIQLFQSSVRAYQGNEQTADLDLPIYIFQIMGGIGIIIFTLPFVLSILQTLIKVVHKNGS
ncbi:TRAP transporter small permease subunit [Salibacterium sp. K-3]